MNGFIAILLGILGVAILIFLLRFHIKWRKKEGEGPNSDGIFITIILCLLGMLAIVLWVLSEFGIDLKNL